VITTGKILAGEVVAAQLIIPFKLVTRENVSLYR
jgi:hypothetical protein